MQATTTQPTPAKPIQSEFPESAPAGPATFYRTYSRRKENAGVSGGTGAGTSRTLENLSEQIDRVQSALSELGVFTEEEELLCREQHRQLKALPSGRWNWVGGTEWVKMPKNFPGAYNCCNLRIDCWEDFGYLLELLSMGTGVGYVSEDNIQKLPRIVRKLNVVVTGEFGAIKDAGGTPQEFTTVERKGDRVVITIGDSREGWGGVFVELLRLCSETYSSTELGDEVDVEVALSHVRKPGSRIQGFGGEANPVDLVPFVTEVAQYMALYIGKKLDALGVTWLGCRAGKLIVAGNVRRSAEMAQFPANDPGADAKSNQWATRPVLDAEGNPVLGEDGNPLLDWYEPNPLNSCLRMANFTRVFHQRPTLEQCLEAAQKQYYSGEGAIQYCPAAIVRVLGIKKAHRQEFLDIYEYGGVEAAKDWTYRYFAARGVEVTAEWVDHCFLAYGLNPCGEIVGDNFFCNLSEVHLNQIAPDDILGQVDAFRAAALTVTGLLHHEFTHPKFKRSREIDPIIGVSFTGLFDFFVHAFGVDWLRWWQAGRPENWGEEVALSDILSEFNGIFDLSLAYGVETPDALDFKAAAMYLDIQQSTMFRALEQLYLSTWNAIVNAEVSRYCEKHGLKRPNRVTTVQPAGTKSLMTGAAPGWHPPKAQRFIRRITFQANHPVALACEAYGYTIVPSQSCKDENGSLLNDPRDPRATEWLVEIPVEVSWANLPGCDEIDISQFSFKSQADFYLQVQEFWTEHNTSATLEYREPEIEDVANFLFEACQRGVYISAAMLARFDDHQTFPRLPFEPITKEKYEELQAGVQSRRYLDNFYTLMQVFDDGKEKTEQVVACEGLKCEMKDSTL